jgi:hypothetical protein
VAADIVLNANAVGDVVTYVAPGFLAYTGYRLRYPGASRAPGEVLIISVVASLPLVALVMALLPGAQTSSQLGYVAVLLTLALVVGYLGALVRGTRLAKGLLGLLGYRMEAEGSIYSQTLSHLPADAPVLVELKDGRRITGCPRNGPQHKDDGINELYIVYPMVRDDAGKHVDIGGEGIIIPLAEVSNIVLSVDPTGAPTATISEEPDAEPPTLPWRDEADPSGTGSQDNSAADAGGDGPPS